MRQLFRVDRLSAAVTSLVVTGTARVARMGWPRTR